MNDIDTSYERKKNTRKKLCTIESMYIRAIHYILVVDFSSRIRLHKPNGMCTKFETMCVGVCATDMYTYIYPICSSQYKLSCAHTQCSRDCGEEYKRNSRLLPACITHRYVYSFFSSLSVWKWMCVSLLLLASARCIPPLLWGVVWQPCVVVAYTSYCRIPVFLFFFSRFRIFPIFTEKQFTFPLFLPDCQEGAQSKRARAFFPFSLRSNRFSTSI